MVGDSVEIGFAVRKVAIAPAIAMTSLNPVEYFAHVVAHFVTEMVLLLAGVALYRWR